MSNPGAAGYNTFHGFDNGPAPPGFTQQQPVAATFQGYYPQPAVQAYPMPPGMVYPQATFMPPPYQPAPTFANPLVSPNWAAPPPQTDGGFPGIHLRNHTGGIGLPPGYDYAFPREHCKIHVFKTKEKPWQITVYKEDNASHVKLFVPVNTTVKELMQNVGCTNDAPKKNILYEVVEKGNGKWSSGLRIPGDDKERVGKPIKNFGWDQSRTGNPGEKPIVWLWVTKDGQ